MSEDRAWRAWWDEHGHKIGCPVWGDEDMVERCTCGTPPQPLHPDMAEFVGSVFNVMSANLRDTEHMLQDNIAQMAIGYVWQILADERQRGVDFWTFGELMEIIDRARKAVQKKLDLTRSGNSEEEVVP